jgi:hypothetical protein
MLKITTGLCNMVVVASGEEEQLALPGKSLPFAHAPLNIACPFFLALNTAHTSWRFNLAFIHSFIELRSSTSVAQASSELARSFFLSHHYWQSDDGRKQRNPSLRPKPRRHSVKPGVVFFRGIFGFYVQ